MSAGEEYRGSAREVRNATLAHIMEELYKKHQMADATAGAAETSWEVLDKRQGIIQAMSVVVGVYHLDPTELVLEERRRDAANHAAAAYDADELTAESVAR